MTAATPIDLATFTHPLVHRMGDQFWFHEVSPDAFPGQSFGLQIDSILYHTQSPFQDILIFHSTSYGNVLVLNGIVQCTERDEFAYQELITHLPIMAHPAPKKVLVIGGGDCGVLRELVKHVDDGTVESITMVEIDDMVIKLLTQFLPNMARFHNHPSVDLRIEDGFKFLKETTAKYDVIITDSSDPEGPAEEFFQESYFQLLQNALAPEGVVIMQSSENIWLNIEYLRGLLVKAKAVFANVDYCQCYMPSYTSGQLGLVIATNDTSKRLSQPLRTFDEQKERALFKYYSADVHRVSFVMPTWAKEVLGRYLNT
ncbi:spermine synthase [Suhomyces tanzawaensis NRRL Y-17324]|uniref:Spermine synthase n=1 Tax=Suhomyces tanzawaensis NRRL Y-17324 TaxID=984487 RepID=A0A1E4SEP5_9ASCO|nr:spermine synthase [Suhomyces tanzawaensis NRRL Y-17324]ODV77994.1 spermine synthase [Suhomyces tanzawaensis NRRL Y-17324]